MRIHGTTSLITGASRGLGAALARELAARGSRVVLVARGEEALTEVVSEIRDLGGEAFPIVADVGDPEAAFRIAGEASALAGPVDVLVHNASALGPLPMPLLLDTSPEAFERVFQVNVLGPFRLIRALVGQMALRQAGVVVGISSDAAVEAYAGWGAYSASKAALDHLIRVLAAEVGEHGLRCFAVDPGEMDTAMHRDALPDADPATLADPRDVARAIAGMIEADGAVPNGARLVASAWRAL